MRKKMKKMIQPCGYRILVKVDSDTLTKSLKPGEYVRDGKIYTAFNGGEIEIGAVNVAHELKGANTGTVISMGDRAYKGREGDFPKPWCKPGDRVVFKRYEGWSVGGETFGDKDTEYMLINDTDIWGVISEVN
jgi:co-chaperonin GroES (HSP10)